MGNSVWHCEQLPVHAVPQMLIWCNCRSMHIRRGTSLSPNDRGNNLSVHTQNKQRSHRIWKDDRVQHILAVLNFYNNCIGLCSFKTQLAFSAIISVINLLIKKILSPLTDEIFTNHDDIISFSFSLWNSSKLFLCQNLRRNYLGHLYTRFFSIILGLPEHFCSILFLKKCSWSIFLTSWLDFTTQKYYLLVQQFKSRLEVHCSPEFLKQPMFLSRGTKWNC